MRRGRSHRNGGLPDRRLLAAMPPPLPLLTALRRRLLRWYDRNQRDLPWRRSANPYHIWVSEVMLQQTRVQAVIPYYESFLRRFPSVQALAAAPEEDLLASWSGLGYYSRARNLRKAAEAIVRQHGGRFPRHLDAALALPGVGRYTAAAVLSIAYRRPLAVLDGNVGRVLSRLFAVPAEPRREPETYRRLAESLLARRRPGDFNQAIMELGATLCLPRHPQCGRCPLRRECRAFQLGQTQSYPPARRKSRPALRRYIAAVVLDRVGRVLLLRRSQEAPWLAGFWELPTWEVSTLKQPEWLALAARLGTVRHAITENRLEVAVYSASRRGRLPSGARWFSAAQLAAVPLTTVSRKALALRGAREEGAASWRSGHDPA